MGAKQGARDAPVVQVYGALDALAGAHGAALGYAAQQDLFRALEWFECLAAHGLGDGRRTRAYAATMPAVPGALCVLYAASEAGGRRLTSLTSVYSVAFAPVFAPATPDSARAPLIAAICRFIRAERPRWRTIELRLLDADDPDTGRLERGLSALPFRAHRFFQYENWYAPTAGTGFDAYWAARESRVRNTIGRRERRLRAAHAVAIDIAGDAAPARLDAYAAIYAASWKGAEPAPEFIRALCRTAARLGRLRLGLLTVDGAPAAAQLWLMSGRTAMIYKLAYDERFKDHSPGSILTREMMRHALEADGAAEIDYGIGSEPYKREWMTAKRSRVGIEAFGLATAGGAAGALRQLAAAALRRLRGR